MYLINTNYYWSLNLQSLNQIGNDRPFQCVYRNTHYKKNAIPKLELSTAYFFLVVGTGVEPVYPA